MGGAKKQERYECTSPPISHRKAQEDERDPVIAAFFRFIEKQTAVHLDDIVEADSDQLRRIGKLVTGAWQWIGPAPECQWMDPNIDELLRLVIRAHEISLEFDGSQPMK
jgi:hypothetical protein